MMALVLKLILAAEAAALAGFAPALAARFGMAGAALFLVAAFVGIQALLIGVAYAVSRRHASPRPAGVGPLTFRAVLEELVAFLAFFVVLMPFERRFMGPDTLGRLPAGTRPVLLVHGYMCNRGFWWWLRRGLQARGLAVATVNLETPVSDIEALAELLDRRLSALLAETGAEQAMLVTHSMGGLVARAMMRRFGSGHVARFVTLAGPHHGTAIARLGPGRNARQMEPGNPWLAELDRAGSPPVPTLTIWSAGDEIVAPQDSSRLDGAREIVLPAGGHLAIGLSPQVLEAVAAELAG